MAQELNCEPKKLLDSMKKCGYPIFHSEHVGLYKNKGGALMQFNLELRKSNIQRRED